MQFLKRLFFYENRLIKKNDSYESEKLRHSQRRETDPPSPRLRRTGDSCQQKKRFFDGLWQNTQKSRKNRKTEWKHCLFREASANWKPAPTARHSRVPASFHYAATSRVHRILMRYCQLCNQHCKCGKSQTAQGEAIAQPWVTSDNMGFKDRHRRLGRSVRNGTSVDAMM